MNTATPAQPAGSNSVLVVVCASLFFGVLNASAVTVLLPAIGVDFALDRSQISWIMSAYLLIYGVAIPFYGKLSDRFGVRNLFLLGLGLFSVGSLLCAVAPNYLMLMLARLVQAAGGAAIPGLGMTLVSRAFASEQRGKALGVVSATMGVGAAIGPLLAGAITDLLDWRYLFGMSVLAAIVIPYGIEKLQRDQDLSEGPLDLFGGFLLAVFVTGTLFSISQGPQLGWMSPFVLSSVGAALLALVILVFHQSRVDDAFISKTLLHNKRYLAVLLMGFCATGIFLSTQVALPMFLVSFNQLSPLNIGLILMPGAILTAVLGVVAGRMVDKVGAGLPTRIGGILTLIAMLGLSVFVGSSEFSIMVFTALLGAGYALLNTPLAIVVSLVVPAPILASALSLNTMVFFTGGSFGTAFLSSLVVGHNGQVGFNPWHNGLGAGFSDAFLILTLPLIVILLLTLVLPKVEQTPEPKTLNETWHPDCNIPWMPECEHAQKDHEHQLAK